MLFEYGCDYCDYSLETDIKSSNSKCPRCKKLLSLSSSFGLKGCYILNDSNAIKESNLATIPEMKPQRLLRRASP